MKMLKRNQVTIWYALFKEKLMRKDSEGRLTGEYDIVYSFPEQLKVNLSPNRGESFTEPFGENVQYERVMVFARNDIPFDESSILWISTQPFDESGNPIPHDYIVKAVATSINHTSVAVSRVTVRG